VTFLSSYQSQREIAQSGLIIPARTDVAYSDVFLSPLQAPKSGRVFLDVMEHGYPTHTPVSWDEVSETITEALEPVWDGSQPVSVAMRRLKPKVEALLAR
jgi:ABC-type glycerol-3-phosphate transport system substrate-binding protein